MLIDRKHTRWIVATAALGVAATAVYLWDAPRHPKGPGGGTVVGLILGASALAIMLFAAALGIKRRVPHWRLGSAATWMRGHIWLGLLVPWLVALHGAFGVGGTLTTAMWVLLGAVVVSGVAGVFIQQVLPRLTTQSCPHETVAQQLPRELANVRLLIEGKVEHNEQRARVVVPGVMIAYAGLDLDQPAPPFSGDQPLADSEINSLRRRHEPVPGAEPMRRLYVEHVRPFLAGSRGARLSSEETSTAMFDLVRRTSPPHMHPGIGELEALCRRRRELLRQRRLMWLTMGWLFVHVPLAWVLTVLSVAHALVALRY
jgi:hypothetical protein